jgi:hypothetical protein
MCGVFSRRHAHLAARRILAGALLLLIFAGKSPGGDETAPAVKIAVRSHVDERWKGFRKLGTIEHGKIYAIISIKETPSAQKLVAPVSEGRLVRQLREVLAARGFTEIVAGQRPDILLTVLYGRGFLKNPYLKGAMVDELSWDVPVSTITDPDQALRQRQAGYEAKLQGAQLEKLFIRVAAWKYPESPDEKPANLWATTMVVDSPDRRDLNQFTAAMLAAGAEYFDRPMKEEEVRMDSAAPTGSVTLGPLKVVEEEVKDEK